MKTSVLLWIYLVLMILLVATIGMALQPLASEFKPIAGLLVAILKGGLIVLFFMQLRYHQGLIRVFAASGTFCLFLLFLLIATDYLTRE